MDRGISGFKDEFKIKDIEVEFFNLSSNLWVCFVKMGIFE